MSSCKFRLCRNLRRIDSRLLHSGMANFYIANTGGLYAFESGFWGLRLFAGGGVRVQFPRAHDLYAVFLPVHGYPSLPAQRRCGTLRRRLSGIVVHTVCDDAHATLVRLARIAARRPIE